MLASRINQIPPSTVRYSKNGDRAGERIDSTRLTVAALMHAIETRNRTANEQPLRLSIEVSRCRLRPECLISIDSGRGAKVKRNFPYKSRDSESPACPPLPDSFPLGVPGFKSRGKIPVSSLSRPDNNNNGPQPGSVIHFQYSATSCLHYAGRLGLLTSAITRTIRSTVNGIAGWIDTGPR